MNRRRVTCTLGPVAGGLLGAALLPLAVAMADDSDFDPASYTFKPVAPETVIGLYNSTAAPPGVDESIQGYQPFSVIDGDGGDTVGTFYAYESTFPYLAPYQPGGSDASTSNQTLFVTSDVPGSDHTTGTVPPDGSVFSTMWFSGHTFENVYSAVPSSDGHDVVTDTLVTPLGNVPLTWLFSGLLGFDAADVPAVLPDYIKPVGDPVFTAVSGIPPLTIAPQGYQQFDYYDPAGANVGTFGAVTTTTTDGYGFHTQALLVTDVPPGTDTGTAATDVPPIGSVFNTMELNALPDFSVVYSSLPSPDGDEVKTVLNTPLGPVDLSFLFGSYDASAGLADGSAIQPFSFGNDTIKPDPTSPEVFTGMNGLPPSNAAIQGYQLFDVTDAQDNPAGTFTAAVTSIPNMWLSQYSLALLVTSDGSGTVGTAPGDVPPVGSVFDIHAYGLGFENIYWSLPSPDGGADVIKDILVTPLGPLDVSWLAQGTDAAAGLTDVVHAGSDWTALFSPPVP